MSKLYYAVIDTETCTIPALKDSLGDKAGLVFPLVYDLGLTIMDRSGTIMHQQSWIIAETYSNPELFNTGYYAWKRPIYEEQIKRGETKVETWYNARLQLLKILTNFNAIACAYNAFFDFKKAFHATNRYISTIYKPDGKTALEKLVSSVLTAETEKRGKREKDSAADDEAKFWLVDRYFRIIDIWDFACTTFFQTRKYKAMALENGWYSDAGNFRTNAEVAYRFVTNNMTFDEDHTALSDTAVEAVILAYIFEHYKVKIPYGLTFNPWQKVGKIPKDE